MVSSFETRCCLASNHCLDCNCPGVWFGGPHVQWGRRTTGLGSSTTRRMPTMLGASALRTTTASSKRRSDPGWHSDPVPTAHKGGDKMIGCDPGGPRERPRGRARTPSDAAAWPKGHPRPRGGSHEDGFVTLKQLGSPCRGGERSREEPSNETAGDGPIAVDQGGTKQWSRRKGETER